MNGSAGGDPHHNLPTDVPTTDEIYKFLKTAMHHQNWPELMMAWNLGDNSFLRGDSARKLKISDLLLDGGHAPNLRGADGTMNEKMIAFILRGLVHKDRAKQNRVTGVWRSKEYLRCGAFSVALSCFYRLSTAPSEELHFRKPTNPNNPRQAPAWQEIPLLKKWDATERGARQHRADFEAVYSRAGVRSWDKCTHIRKLGTERASCSGLIETEIGSLSKHTTDKISTRYVTELNPDTLLVMSLHQKGEIYFVPRTLLQLPLDFSFTDRPLPANYSFSEQDLVECIWPKIVTWKQELNLPGGDYDKSNCAAENFLYETLPWMAMVLFQDGIYLIEEFPTTQRPRSFFMCCQTGIPTGLSKQERSAMK